MSLMIIARDVLALGKTAPTSVPTQSTRANGLRSIQISVEADAGPVAATVKLLGCNDGRYPIEMATFELSSADAWATDVFPDASHCDQYLIDVVSRTEGARVSAIGSI